MLVPYLEFQYQVSDTVLVSVCRHLLADMHFRHFENILLQRERTSLADHVKADLTLPKLFSLLSHIIYGMYIRVVILIGPIGDLLISNSDLFGHTT